MPRSKGLGKASMPEHLAAQLHMHGPSCRATRCSLAAGPATAFSGPWPPSRLPLEPLSYQIPSLHLLNCKDQVPHCLDLQGCRYI